MLVIVATVATVVGGVRPGVAQSATLRGVVVDSASLASLSGVEVHVAPGGLSTLTDESGAFALQGIAAGDHVLQFSGVGFQLLEFAFTIAPDQMAEMDVGLVPLVRIAPVDIRILGAVIDAGTGDGVPGAEIYIDEYLVGVVNTYGAFDIPLEASLGNHQIRIRRVGYIMGEYTLSVDAPGQVEFEFELQPLATELQEIVVEVPEAVRGKLAGFYTRRQSEHGVFMSPEQVEALRPNVRQASGFFERMRGVRTTPTPYGREIKLTRCQFPSYFVDGQQMDVTRIDEMFLVDDIEAIEVYDGVTRVPLEFNRPPLGAITTGTTCGAIVIWTRSP